MKKLTILSASALMIAATGAYAHHPAADIVDPDIYAMIEENISDVHLAMTFDDMGGDTTDVGGSMQSRDTDVGNMGDAMGGDVADVGAEIGGNMEDIGAAMEAREEMNAMADVESRGQDNARR